jgi:hypothetical protein
MDEKSRKRLTLNPEPGTLNQTGSMSNFYVKS